jgi:hypothetical protein
MSILTGTVKQWFPTLASNESVKTETLQITGKQDQLYSKTVVASDDLANTKTLIATLSGGSSLSELKTHLATSENLLKGMKPGSDAAVKEEGLVASQKAQIDTIAGLQKDAAKDSSVIKEAEKQYSELQTLKDGLDGSFTKLYADVTNAAKSTNTTLTNGVKINTLPPTTGTLAGAITLQ